MSQCNYSLAALLPHRKHSMDYITKIKIKEIQSLTRPRSRKFPRHLSQKLKICVFVRFIRGIRMTAREQIITRENIDIII